MRPADEQLWRRAHGIAAGRLLAERGDGPFWAGRLSDSALATATAISALALADRDTHGRRIEVGLAWLIADQNDDGGWGDSPASDSNLPTTLLAKGALAIAGRTVNDAAESYIASAGGIEAILGLYGADRTFSVPILTHAAIAGSVDWVDVPALPMELAALPRWLFRFLRMPVVSYALPALIAIGLVRAAAGPSRNPLARGIRRLVRPKVLRTLEQIQPASGGFLEATPLTSFVAMSMVHAGLPDHPVTKLGVQFLIDSQRDDGAWPIDSDLATWNTTMATRALDGGEPATRDWLLNCQQRARHSYTDTAPGGWGWSHRAGSVPDADDTAGALLALGVLPGGEATQKAVPAAAKWLLNLQNGDGGWPTFCRGWGKLEFDRSGCDLTGHVLRALHRWRGDLPAAVAKRIGYAVDRGVAFLARSQRPDGSWLPLWFGSQHTPDHANPVFGTARVLLAYRDLGLADADQARRGRGFLYSAAGADGGFGAALGVSPSIEETASALEALADPETVGAGSTVDAAASWLARQVIDGGLDRPAPIGLYFARLWYHERLYPVAMAAGSLRATIASIAGDGRGQ